jgi:hypothetical protein
MSTKRRLSASVDAAVMTAAQAAVSDGRAANISAWVNEALYRQAERDRRMRASDEFLLSYEAKHGVISEAEMQAASHRARARAVVVRGAARVVSKARDRRRSGGAR